MFIEFTVRKYLGDEVEYDKILISKEHITYISPKDNIKLDSNEFPKITQIGLMTGEIIDVNESYERIRKHLYPKVKKI